MKKLNLLLLFVLSVFLYSCDDDNNPNTDATNETGFTALPGGYRHSYGGFDDVGDEGNWWSATESDAFPLNVYSSNMEYDISYVNRFSKYKVQGFSVRCVKD